jgi:hypothetical protein
MGRSNNQEETNKKISLANKGKKRSAEAKLKMRLAKLGKKRQPHTQETKLKISVAHLGMKKPWAKHLLQNFKIGYKHSLEWKKSLSEAMRGDKHPNWQGGISPINERIRHSLEYKLWRKAVYERDNYTCIWCGVKGNGKNLNADHIKPFWAFEELRFSLDNGRTLCVPCHRKTDTWGKGSLKYEKFNYPANWTKELVDNLPPC